eukprot:8130496-Ditylum_brightwellii.AAC.1
MIDDDMTPTVEDDTHLLSNEDLVSSEDWDEYLEGHIYLDAYTASATHARQKFNMPAKLLSKVWKISHDNMHNTLLKLPPNICG